jgi:hypothetical protein
VLRHPKTIHSNHLIMELAENKPVKPQRRGVVLAPKGGVKMILKGKRVQEEQKEPARSLY